MAAYGSPAGATVLHPRRRSLDLSHLSTKYPWLRIDSETIEEFRSPFQWVPAGDNEDTGSRGSESSADEDPPQRTAQKPQRRPRANFSLAQKRGRARASPSKRKRLARSHDDKDAFELLRVAPSSRVTRSESEETEKWTPQETVVFPPSLVGDFQALKHQQRARQQAKAKTKKPHSILSLRFPVLQKPSPKPTSGLALQIEQATKEELLLQQQLHQQIQAEKAKLPLTFLFERQLDKTYCKHKSIETITSIFSKLQHRMLFYAFHHWLALRGAERERERREAAVQKAQRKALAFFERLASDAYVGTLDRALRRWRDTARELAADEMRAAAVKIQGLYRQRRAKSLMQDLKQASLDREYKRRVEIQRLLRFESYGTAMKWSTLKSGFNLLLLSLCSKRITCFFRRIRTRKRIARRLQRRLAATKIQCQWRCRIARATQSRLERARQIQRERERAAAVHLQRTARGYLARHHAALRRVQLSHESISAGHIQRAWRRHCDRRKLSMRFQRRRQLLDIERARQAELERIEAARQNELMRNRVVVHIQRVARGFLGRREAARRRDARTLERAVRRAQQSWRKSKGRYALHIRFLAQRERLDDRRNASALLLQCRFRVRKARQQRHTLERERQRRRQSAIAIQRIARGRHARAEYATTRRATVAIQSVWRGKLARLERERLAHEKELREQQRFQATLKLQCLARGRQARRLTRQLRSEQQRMELLLQQSAVLIQKRARGIEARKTALLLKQAMQLVDLQQQRAYANSTQLSVAQSPLLGFVMRQYAAKSSGADDGDGLSGYSREQLQWFQWQIDAARQQMAREDRAVVSLQRRYRGFATRVAFLVRQVQLRERLQLEDRAARTLQHVGRGFLARRRVLKRRAKRRSDELKDAYVRERKWKEQERAWQEQFKQEQLALQLLRLQARDAKREAEIAKWNAEAAAARKQELREQLEARKIERALRGGASEDEGGDEEPAWAYVADAYGNWYYYNAATGESAWEKPAERRANPTKRRAKATTQQKPSGGSPTKDVVGIHDDVPTEPKTTQASTPVPEGFCCKCKAVEADKECLDCLLPDLSLAVLYCAPCFTLEHNLLAATSAKGAHDFKVLRPVQLPSECQRAGCATPKTKASYHCGTCPAGSRFSCEACFPLLHDSAQSSHHIPDSLHFRAGSLRCVECREVLATRRCAQYDEAFCAACFERLHGPSPTKKQHEFTPLEIFKDDLPSAKDAHCVDCELRLCTRLCNLCGDGYCDACFAASHRKGQKTQHTWIPWASFAARDDWLEILDEKSGKLVFFNIETKESTHTQPFVLKSGEERHRGLFAEREAAMKSKALALESEIVKLKEQLQAVEQQKDLEIERLRRRRRRDDEGDEPKPGAENPKKKGLFGGRESKKKTTTQDVAASEQALSPEELKRLALRQSIQQSPSELALINSKLMTRDRQEKEEKAKRAVGTKHFEEAMLQELARSGAPPQSQ